MLTNRTREPQFFREVPHLVKLLNYVHESDYASVEKLIRHDPKLIFEHFSFKNAEGRYESMSPAKLAFKLHDTWMWKIFLEKILGISSPLHLLAVLPTNTEGYRNSHILVYPHLYFVNMAGIIKEKSIKDTESLQCFLEQENEQTTHISSLPDIDVLHRYAEIHSKWIIDQNSEEKIEEIKKAWLDIGKSQRELPRHFLLEFCNSPSWSLQSTFDVNVNPRPESPAKYYNLDYGKPDLDPLPLMPNTGLGYDFTLFRGTYKGTYQNAIGTSWKAWLSSHWLTQLDTLQKDWKILQKLRERREQDLVDLHGQFDLMNRIALRVEPALLL